MTATTQTTSLFGNQANQMARRLTGKPSWGAVKTFRNEDIIQKMMQEYSMSREDALQLFEDTKMFLFLCATHPVGLGPTAKLDDGWHTFILFTREYRDFCIRYLGKFIHHNPIVRYEGADVQPSAPHSVLLGLAKTEFGDNLSKNWLASEGENCNDSGKCCSGGNCSNTGTVLTARPSNQVQLTVQTVMPRR